MSSVLLYDSLTQQKSPLVADANGVISLYVCGLTPYAPCHIGHARTFLVYDLLVRYLRWRGETVNFVRNITDVDDKIIQTAVASQKTGLEVVETNWSSIVQTFADFGLLIPDSEPAVSDYIPPIIAHIEALINKDAAYISASGDVCFRVNAYSDYGQLSNRNLAQTRDGARKKVDETKESQHDFVLWKVATDNCRKAQMVWDSPWGLGRPGWHIECTVMSLLSLGEKFSLHGGGLDLKFPHHENEIAQSEACDKKFARLWMHVAPVRLAREKMSKSEGNFVLLTEAVDKWGKEVIRFGMLNTHYRSPIEYSDEVFQRAQSELEKMVEVLRPWLREFDTAPPPKSPQSPYLDSFSKLLNDDFNTPGTLGLVRELVQKIRHSQDSSDSSKEQAIYTILNLYGIDLFALEREMDSQRDKPTPQLVSEVTAILRNRYDARRKRDFTRADALRDQLAERGIEVRDDPQSALGQLWRVRGGDWNTPT